MTTKTMALSVVFRAMRIRQWTKNLLLFAGLLFAAKLGDPMRWLEALLAFAGYSLGSSAAYLVNDVRDAERDRSHPVKRNRPVASRALSACAAVGLAAALAVLSLAVISVLGLLSLLLLALFLAIQGAYSLQLRELAGVDVLAIAALFTLRAAAGAEAIHVRISPWLLVCTSLLALFLALAKRRGELLAGATLPVPRRTLTVYSVTSLDRLLALVSAATLSAYAIYALTARHSPEMAVTIPFAAAAVARYLVLVHRDGLGEAPDEILLTDLPILAAVGGWAIAAGSILMLS